MDARNQFTLMKAALIVVSCVLKSYCINAQNPDLDLPDHFLRFATTHPGHCRYVGEQSSKSIALTFDDGPSAITNEVLDLLDQHEIRSTFFWQGKNLIERPDIVRRAIDAGHELGNHSWDHPQCGNMGPFEMWNSQIRPTQNVFDSLYNLEVKLYRPPFGTVTEDQLIFLAERNISTILWSLSTFDWDVERNSSEEISMRFISGLHPGAIVLLHDMDFDNSVSGKLEAIENIIAYAKAVGYQFLTVSELVNFE